MDIRVRDDTMWGVSSQQGQRELVVRVPRAHADEILASSGRDGCFWRSTEKACRDSMPVVALQKGATRAVALEVAKRAGGAPPVSCSPANASSYAHTATPRWKRCVWRPANTPLPPSNRSRVSCSWARRHTSTRRTWSTSCGRRLAG
ncbi:hypothetical protein DIPPA_09190 [Diplonema papillatum]|nr:hypothetical protein DIPPA_09190 [Diplonema papillatum]